MENKMLENIIGKLDFIEDAYDMIRLVDPVHKEVISLWKSNNMQAQPSGRGCFDFWQRGQVCENCISMRAFNQKRTTVKIEYRGSSIFMVTSVPLRGESDTNKVVELFKDITDDGVINIDGLEPVPLRKLINRRNEAAIKDVFTRIYNEQYIYERLPHDILWSQERSMPIALFLIKISNIQFINTTYGNTAIERVVKESAGVFNLIIHNKSDWVSRYDKTDFVLVMHKMNENKVRRVYKRIHDKTSHLEFNFGHETIRINVSIGYHILKNEKITPEQFILKANKMIPSLTFSAIESNSTKQYDKFLEEYFLTPREKDVALLLMKGNSNIEIAETMFVGLSTVKKHVSSIFTKTRVKSRAEFIANLAHD
jgi:diguanylate cyclase (GGDEF)-like protein